MPTPKTINLTYDANGNVIPEPNPVFVQAGDTLNFVVLSPPNGEVTITFNQPDLFSKGDFRHGDTPVSVKKAASSTYRCILRVNGQVVADSAKSQGGSIEPGSGD